MKVHLLYLFLIGPVLVFGTICDTLPEVYYFNGNFELQQNLFAAYTGKVEKLEKKQYQATLYSPANLKIATVGYSGKELSFRNGRATGYFYTGMTQFITHFNRNVLDGAWISYYENGQPCDSGTFFKNVPDGTWTGYYKDGTPRMVVQFNGRKHIQVREDMRRMYRPLGNSTLAPGSGTVVIMRTGNLRGQQALIRAQFQLMQNAIFPSMIVGRFKGLSLKRKVDMNTDSKSTEYAPPYEECLIHGLYKSYFPDGKLKDSGYSHNGLQTGVWQEYSGDSRLMSRGFYKRGVKRGDWRYYNADGKFIFLRRFNRQGKEKEIVHLTMKN